jgi:chemotaxis family two-component system response regulator Rcp1
MPLEVLVVEDSSGDIRLTREAFRDVNPFIHLEVAHDGVEAMAFLRRQGVHLNAPRPDLILLDLNLPKMDGRQVLALIKEDDTLKTIPTVILTSSEAEADVLKSYQLQANCYLSKPMHFEAFHGLVKSINDFWLTKVKLPQQRDNVDEPEPGAHAGHERGPKQSRGTKSGATKSGATKFDGTRRNNESDRRQRSAH